PRRPPAGDRHPGPSREDPRDLGAQPVVPREEARHPGPHPAALTVHTFTDAIAELIGRVARVDGPLVDLVSRLLVIALALIAALAGYRALARVVDRLLRPLEGAADYPARVQRARTLAPLMKNAALYGIWFLAGVVILREIGVDVRALLVSAGVLGLAVGLGA